MTELRIARRTPSPFHDDVRPGDRVCTKLRRGWWTWNVAAVLLSLVWIAVGLAGGVFTLALFGMPFVLGGLFDRRPEDIRLDRIDNCPTCGVKINRYLDEDGEESREAWCEHCELTTPPTASNRVGRKT